MHDLSVSSGNGLLCNFWNIFQALSCRAAWSEIGRVRLLRNFFWPVLYQSLTETKFLTFLTRAARVGYS